MDRNLSGRETPSASPRGSALWNPEEPAVGAAPATRAYCAPKLTAFGELRALTRGDLAGDPDFVFGSTDGG